MRHGLSCDRPPVGTCLAQPPTSSANKIAPVVISTVEHTHRNPHTPPAFMKRGVAEPEAAQPDRQQMSATPFYRPVLWRPLSVPSIAITDKRAQGRCGEVCCAIPPARVRYRRAATVLC